jgi:ureidoacrylate peracid hydrolase
MRDFGLNRNVPVIARQTALLVIDVQNYNMEKGGEYAGMDAAEKERRYGYFFREMRNRTIPNIQNLLAAARKAKIEVIYTVIASHTQDGRDLSLDYKISGLFCPKDSIDAQVLEDIRPQGDEIVLPKTSSSVFISTNIHYILGNLGIKQLIITGALTDQCVDSAVRDACDIGSHREVLAERFPQHRFDHLPDRWWPEGRETLEEATARADWFRAEMKSREDEDTTLLVSHWAFILALTGISAENGEVLHYDPRSPAPQNITWRP